MSKPLVVLVVIGALITRKSKQKIWFLEASNTRFSLIGRHWSTPPPPLKISHQDLIGKFHPLQQWLRLRYTHQQGHFYNL
jgi:hypothetical protein